MRLRAGSTAMIVLLNAFLACALLAAPPETPGAATRRNFSPRLSPNAMVGQTIGVTEVTVEYGRPSARGRQLLGGLMPLDGWWRTGADEATIISFSYPVKIEGRALAAGSYSLFTRPGKERWDVIFNRVVGQWGLNYDPAQDALRATVEPQTGPFVEQLTFSFTDVSDSTATLWLAWGEVRVPARISTDTEANVRDRATKGSRESRGDWRGPREAAQWALGRGIYLEEALEWIDVSIAAEEHALNLHTKAQLLVELGRQEEAARVARKALGKGMPREKGGEVSARVRNDLEKIAGAATQ